jgi:hypothetical protein
MADLQYGAALSSVVQIRDGDYSDLTGAALVMITVRMNEKPAGRQIARDVRRRTAGPPAERRYAEGAVVRIQDGGVRA